MKDRLRKEIMESRKQEEEAALLDQEETEEVHLNQSYLGCGYLVGYSQVAKNL